MALPPLATIEDVAALLQRDLTPAEVTNGVRLLGMASDVVRRYTRQQITQATETITLPGNWDNTLVLPQRPITAVSNVLINGATPSYTLWRVLDDTLFLGTGAYQPDFGVLLWSGNALWGPAGSNSGPQATGATWGGPQAQVTVTYTHGYAEVPGDIVNVTAGLVAIAIASPVGVDQERVGGYQVKYTRSEGGSMALQAGDKEILNYYRKRAISSSIATVR
jgi:hypothetical protein